MNQRTLSFLFLLFLATACLASPQTPKIIYKRHHYKPFSVQTPFSTSSNIEKRKDVKQSSVWTIPVQQTISGGLLSDVKHRRAVYEATESELVRFVILVRRYPWKAIYSFHLASYIIPTIFFDIWSLVQLISDISSSNPNFVQYLISTPDSDQTTKVECTRGDGWFYSVPNLPNSQICLPWSFWSPNLIRSSSFYPVAGQPLCSAPVPLENYPQCGLGYHCNVDAGKCELSKQYKTEIPGVCPSNSGLVWSRSKGRCVQCLASNIRILKYTNGLMPPDYYRLGYVCDSDGNAYPPLTVNMSQQLYLIPSAFFNLCICIIMMLLASLHVSLYFHGKQLRNKYKHISNSNEND